MVASASRPKSQRAIAKLKLVHIATLLPLAAATAADNQPPPPIARPIPTATAPTPNQIIARARLLGRPA